MAVAAVLDHALNRPVPSSPVSPVRLNPQALRDARQAAGYSLDHVGAVIGRTASVVARYERGQIDLPASMLGAFAALYRVEVGDFFHRTQ